MAIEIIKRGEIPNPKYTATCHKCKTEVTFLQSDARYQNVHYSRDQREQSFHYVDCPVCSAQIADMGWTEVVSR